MRYCWHSQQSSEASKKRIIHKCLRRVIYHLTLVRFFVCFRQMPVIVKGWRSLYLAVLLILYTYDLDKCWHFWGGLFCLGICRCSSENTNQWFWMQIMDRRRTLNRSFCIQSVMGFDGPDIVRVMPLQHTQVALNEDAQLGLKERDMFDTIDRQRQLS